MSYLNIRFRNILKVYIKDKQKITVLILFCFLFFYTRKYHILYTVQYLSWIYLIFNLNGQSQDKVCVILTSNDKLGPN
jgi:hypothetical protein